MADRTADPGISPGGTAAPTPAAGTAGQRAAALFSASGLTQAEAADRGARIGRTTARVCIDLGRFAADGTFTSTTTVDFDCAGTGPIWLDLIAERVISLRHNDIDLDPRELAGAERLVIPTPQASNTVTVTAEHQAGAQAAGLSRSVDRSDGTVYAWTQFQPFDARRMLPCFDQPDLRAEFTVEVIAPAEWTCVSNMRSDGTGSRADAAAGGPPDGLRRWVFAPTPPIPVYLLALCAGPFAVITGEHQGMPLGLYARAGLADELASSSPELLALTAHGMDTFGEAFALPCPGDSYDHVFLPDQPGAMENLGCITWNDAALFRTEPTPEQRARRGMVLLHELSHQWFGNLVSPRWWDDLWLSESFADWAGHWALRSYPELADHGGNGAVDFKAVAIRGDQAPSTHPISRRVPDMAAVEASFDAITYAKGAFVLNQLIERIGEPDFLAGLRRYFARFGWAATTVDGLLDELDRVTDLDVRRWAAEWLRTAGVNTLRLEVDSRLETDGGAAGRTGPTVRLLQEAPAAWPLLRTHRLELEAYRLVDGSLVRDRTVSVTVSGPAAEIGELTGAADAELLLVDSADGAYAIGRLDPRSMRTLLAYGQTLVSAGARTSMRRLLAEAVTAGELPAAEAVHTLSASLRTERDDSAFVALTDAAVQLAHRFSAPRDRGPVGELIAEACLSVAQTSAPGTARQQRAWLVASDTAWADRSVGQLRRALEVGDRRPGPSGVRASGAGSPRNGFLPQTLRWRLVRRLVALGDDPSLIDLELTVDTDPDSWLSAEIAAAAEGSLAAKRLALDRLLDPAHLPAGALAPFAEGLWQPHQDAVLVDIAASFLDRLPGAVSAGGTARAARLARWAFPTSGLTAATVRQAKDLADRVDLPEVVRLALADQAFEAERALRVSAGRDDRAARRGQA